MRRLKSSIAASLLLATLFLPLGQAWAAEQAAPVVPAAKAVPAEESIPTGEPAADDSTAKTLPEAEADPGEAPAEDSAIAPADPQPLAADPEAVPFNLAPPTAIKQSLPGVDVSTGALSYQLPLRIPAGRRGLQPDLSLSYNSQNLEEGSLAGFGWTMAIPSIERKNLNGLAKMFAAHDFSASAAGDLMATGGSAGVLSFAPKTENGDFSKYAFYEGPDGGHWVMQTKQGMTYRFGSSSAARLADPADASHTFRWYLDSVEDRLGNSVSYSYERDGGQVYPSAITYTNYNGSDGLFRIAFTYEERPDTATRASAGFTVALTKRLSRIEAFIGADQAGMYELAYEASPANGRSLLSRVQYTGYDDKQSPTIEPANLFHYGQGGATDLLDSITQPTGGRTSVAYTAGARYRLASGQLANPKLPFTLQTVSRIAFDDARGHSWQNSFQYEGGSYFYNGPFDRRFAGFERVVKTDAAGTQTISYYHQGNGNNAAYGERADDAGKIGKSYKTEILDSGGQLFVRIMNSWETTALPAGRAFVKLAQSLQADYDGNATHRDKAASYEYDPANGNLVRKNEWGEVQITSGSRFNDIGDDAYQSDYQYAQGAGISFLSSETVRDQSQAKVSETRHYYDNLPFGQVAAGNETRTENWIAGTAYAASESSFDQFGMLMSQRDSRGNETTFAYDSYQLYPILSTNPLGQTTAAAYDYSSGQKAQTTDANGAIAITVFDGLDRPLQQMQSAPQQAGDKELAVDYEYTDTPGQSSVRERHYLANDASADTYAYFDGFGRKIQSRQHSGPNGQFTVTDTIYGADDTVSKQSLPYFGSGSDYQAPTLNDALYTSYAYDALKRPLSAVSAVGTIVTAYDDWKTTVTDQAGVPKSTVSDAYGNLAEVDEHNGSEIYVTSYRWNGLRKLVGLTDALGNVRQFTYDGLGRVLMSEDLHFPGDPKFGTWSYAYDAASNLIRRVDPNSVTVTYAYDALNRLLTEDAYADGRFEVRNTYDACRNGLGRLCSTETPDALISQDYDVLGRVTSETKRLTDGSFTSNYGYDRRGERTLLTNPDGSQLRYGYDEAGRMNRVERKEASDKDFLLVVAVAGFAPNDSPLTVAYGNGVETSNSYDENELYRLRHKRTEARGEPVQDLEYAYDAVGDITRIVDASSTATAKTVDYSYDGLHRLTEAAITDARHPDGGNAVQTFAYDAIGNIINKSDVGAYRYATDPGSFANPHAVIKAGTTDYSYDNNGNLISSLDAASGQKTTYSWDYANRLLSVKRSDATFAYAYDASGQRLRSDGPEGRTLTLSAEYTVLPRGVDKHVFLGDTAVASVSGSGGEAVPYYIHTDHLAGSNAITTADQTVDELTDYYAFGSIRLDDKNSERSEKRKFTGHEYDEGTGLTYANARYYDARLGRFLSQDLVFSQLASSFDVEKMTGIDYVQYLSSPSFLNSYSYSNNNPLKYYDRTGNFLVLIVPVIVYAPIWVPIAITAVAAVGAGVASWHLGASIGHSMEGDTAGASKSLDKVEGALSVTALGVGGVMEGDALMGSPSSKPVPQDTSARPYSHISDSTKVEEGKSFTAAQKSNIYQANRAKNGGVLRSDLSGEELVPPQKSVRGVTPPTNEAQVDHIVPKNPKSSYVLPGSNSYYNAQVLSRFENRKKSNY